MYKGIIIMNKISKNDYRYSMLDNRIIFKERIFSSNKKIIGIIVHFQKKMHLDLYVYFYDNYIYYRFINFNTCQISEYFYL